MTHKAPAYIPATMPEVTPEEGAAVFREVSAMGTSRVIARFAALIRLPYAKIFKVYKKMGDTAFRRQLAIVCLGSGQPTKAPKNKAAK